MLGWLTYIVDCAGYKQTDAGLFFCEQMEQCVGEYRTGEARRAKRSLCRFSLKIPPPFPKVNRRRRNVGVLF
jgi:hypothetical protein